MTRKEYHPSRQRMIKAVETGVVGFHSHLKECESCRVLFELLSKFWADGAEELQQSSPDLLKLIESIPSVSRKERRATVVKGHIVSDSWGRMAYAQLRGVATDLTRRLLLKAGRIKLELAAERHLDKWEFVARVYDQGKASEKFMIKIDGRKIPVGPSGFLYWSSKRPPAKVKLLGESQVIEFEGLSW